MNSKNYILQLINFFVKKSHIMIVILIVFVGLGYVFLLINPKQDQYTATQKIVFNAYKEAPASYIELLGLDEISQKLSQQFSQYSKDYIKSNLKAVTSGNSRIVTITFMGKDEQSARDLLASAKDLSVSLAHNLLMIPQDVINDAGSVFIEFKPAESKKKIILYFASAGMAMSMFILWVEYDLNITKAKK